MVDGETLDFHLEEKAMREKYQPTTVRVYTSYNDGIDRRLICGIYCVWLFP
jgi:hypothetical protein